MGRFNARYTALSGCFRLTQSDFRRLRPFPGLLLNFDFVTINRRFRLQLGRLSLQTKLAHGQETYDDDDYEDEEYEEEDFEVEGPKSPQQVRKSQAVTCFYIYISPI